MSPACESCGAPATRSLVTDWHCGMAFKVCDSCALCTCGHCIVPAGESMSDAGIGDDVPETHSQTGCVVAPVED